MGMTRPLETQGHARFEGYSGVSFSVSSPGARARGPRLSRIITDVSEFRCFPI
jgi:hypothetical protein